MGRGGDMMGELFEMFCCAMCCYGCFKCCCDRGPAYGGYGAGRPPPAYPGGYAGSGPPQQYQPQYPPRYPPPAQQPPPGWAPGAPGYNPYQAGPYPQAQVGVGYPVKQ